MSPCAAWSQVKLQAQQASSTGVRYQGALQCTADILRTEGVKGLYKGASSSLMGVAVESSLLFGTYSQLKKALQVSINLHLRGSVSNRWHPYDRRGDICDIGAMMTVDNSDMTGDIWGM